MIVKFCVICMLVAVVSACGNREKIVTVSEENISSSENIISNIDETKKSSRHQEDGLTPNEDETDDITLPSAIVMASYLRDCRAILSEIMCSLADEFKPQYLDSITLYDKSESEVLKNYDLIFVFEDDLVKISYSDEFDLGSMKVGDVEIALTFEVAGDSTTPMSGSLQPNILNFNLAAMNLNPVYVQKDSTHTVEWNSENTDSCELSFAEINIENLGAIGQQDISFTTDTNVILRCKNDANVSVESSFQVFVVLDPEISSFSVAGFDTGPVVIEVGSTHSITWSAVNATNCELKDDMNLLSTEALGAVDLRFDVSTMISLVCENSIGIQANSTIEVTALSAGEICMLQDGFIWLEADQLCIEDSVQLGVELNKIDYSPTVRLFKSQNDQFSREIILPADSYVRYFDLYTDWWTKRPTKIKIYKSENGQKADLIAEMDFPVHAKNLCGGNYDALCTDTDKARLTVELPTLTLLESNAVIFETEGFLDDESVIIWGIGVRN